MRVLIGRCLILPFTDSTRCTLLTFLVLRLDLASRVAASGSAAPDPFEDDEQPLTRAAAIESAANNGEDWATRLHNLQSSGSLEVDHEAQGGCGVAQGSDNH